MPHTKSEHKWCRVVLSAPNAEELSFQLWNVENVAGVEIIDSNKIACTLNISIADYHGGINSQFSQLGFIVEVVNESENTNWVQKCEEIWQPIKVADFLLLPTLTLETDDQINNSTTIKIVPGLGFGTGHHSSTQLALEFLCQLKQTTFTPSSILDLGTGSGILAIAAKKLWQAEVLGIDIDPDALANATENINLNGLDEEISLIHGDINTTSVVYNLIIANIYAEVLISLVDSFNSRLSSGGYLILSGIMPNLKDTVVTAFNTSDWQKISEREKDNWCSMLYKKI